MTDYDYGSVMHYEANAFSFNGLLTIIPTRNATATVGQRIGMSPVDILEVQRYYGCVATPTTTSTTTTTTAPVTTTSTTATSTTTTRVTTTSTSTATTTTIRMTTTSASSATASTTTTTARPGVVTTETQKPQSSTPSVTTLISSTSVAPQSFSFPVSTMLIVTFAHFSLSVVETSARSCGLKHYLIPLT